MTNACEFVTVIEEPSVAVIHEEGVSSFVIEEPSVVTVIADMEILSSAAPSTIAVIHDPVEYFTVSDVGVQGPPGPQGIQGIPGPQNLFVQNAAPVTAEPTFLWIQTGLGSGADQHTIWFEDGL